MPEYLYFCKECARELVETRKMSDPEPEIFCECGLPMYRNYGQEKASGGGHSYGTGKVSQSLAINPEQIREHNQRYPDIDVRSDGCLVFSDTRQHDKYLTKIGWEKRRKKRKSTNTKTLTIK